MLRTLLRLDASRIVRSGSRDALVLEDSDYHAAIFGLAFRGSVWRDLSAGAHCARGQNVGEGNLRLLFEEIRDVFGAFRA